MSRTRNPYRRAGSWVAGTGWTSEPEPDTPTEDPPTLPTAPDVDELRHGYTLADLSAIARSAALGSVIRPFDYTERYETAFSAAAEALYAAAEPPSPSALRTAALGAVYDLVEEPVRHHGHYRGGRDGWGPATSPAFRSYWADWISNISPDPSDAVVERIAVWQALDLVQHRRRDVIMALAATGDHAAAAQALGLTDRTYAAYLCRARQRIDRAWYAPDPPPQRWSDRRVRSRSEVGTTPTRAHKSLHARLRNKAAKRASTPRGDAP